MFCSPLSSCSPGAIAVAQSLDYETCRDYFLTVEARDGGMPPLSAITTVNINLTDVNDNAPMFSSNLYTAVVSEDAIIGESVVQVGSNESFTYMFVRPGLKISYGIFHLEQDVCIASSHVFVKFVMDVHSQKKNPLDHHLLNGLELTVFV